MSRKKQVYEKITALYCRSSGLLVLDGSRPLTAEDEDAGAFISARPIPAPG